MNGIVVKICEERKEIRVNNVHYIRDKEGYSSCIEKISISVDIRYHLKVK